MWVTLLALILFNAVCCDSRGTSSGMLPKVEIDALWSFFEATDGPNWSPGYNPWNFSVEVVSPCASDWVGVFCYLVNNETHVETISLEYFKLNGTIPPEIGNFTFLKTLQIDSNSLHGPIPKEMGRLAYLETFTVAVNHISGVLPEEFFNCTSLKTASFFYNKLSGTISPAVINLVNMTNLSFGSNSINGTIPSELAKLPKLASLTLDNNGFTGTIPSFIEGDYPLISYMSLDHNSLVGTIPPEFGLLTTLTQLLISHNSLHGTIPPEFSQTKLGLFNFDANQLTGTLPVELSQIAGLYQLYGKNNSLNGTFPVEYYYLPILSYVDLSSNFITGSIVPNISDCLYLTTFAMNDNLLTGSIPNEITTLKQLNDLELSDNFLTGSIPENIGTFKYFDIFHVSNNGLTGPIPDSMVKLNNLIEFEADGNFLSNSIPSGFSSLEFIKILNVSENELTGKIPDVFGNMHWLTQLHLDNNYFSKSLPKSIGKVQSLLVFTINDNYLSGSIPGSFSGLSSLELMFLYSNQLTGSMDNTFDCSAQPHLKFVDVSNNQLTSNLPKELFSCHALKTFTALGNCFSGPLPTEMCGATNLTSLVLDGLMSATSCQKRFFNLDAVVSYGLSSRIPDGIPECLFSLPFLETLHLSGNGLTGTLPEDLILSPTLSYLSLSHNNLRGDIPMSVRAHAWSELDLSYNKITGTLEPPKDKPDSLKDFYFPTNASLSLKVNRLSGNIPPALKHLDSVSILDGNIFECDASRSSLPPEDPDYEIYSCGSNAFNDSIYVWCAVAGCVVVIILGLWYFKVQGFADAKLESDHILGSVGRLWQWIMLWMSVFDKTPSTMQSSLQHVRNFGVFVSGVRNVFVWLTLFIVVILLPTYLALSEYYDTYTHEYAWSVSGAYLSGVTPSVLLFFLLLLYGVCGAGAIYLYFHLQNPDESSDGNSNDQEKRKWFQSAALLAVVMWNIVLVTGVNVAYVYIDHNYSSTVVQVTQLCVALFKVTWNNVIVQYVLERQHKDQEYESELERLSMSEEDATKPQYKLESNVRNDEEEAVQKSANDAKSPHGIGLAVFVMLFNNIAAPFIATGYVSSNCFYDIVTSPPPVSVSYAYVQCSGIVQDSNVTFCASYAAGSQNTVSYPPPFLYSYQCASTFITTYANIFILMLTIDSFFVPLMLWMLKILCDRLKPGTTKWLVVVLPKLFAITDVIKLLKESVDRASNGLSTDKQKPVVLFKVDVFVVKLINVFAVLCTFGVILPPVAVICCVAAFSVTYQAQLLIGRFVYLARPVAGGTDDASMDGRSSAVQLRSILNRDCEGAVNMFLSGVHMIVPFAAIFFGLVLFDTLGDAVGWERALVVPLLICFIPLLVYLRRCANCRVLKRLCGCGRREVRRSLSKETGETNTYVHHPSHLVYAPLEEHEPDDPKMCEVSLPSSPLSMTLLQEDNQN